MSQQQPVDTLVAIPTLVGSYLSFLATFTAIVFHIAFPPKRHFRHALIINLLISDLLNSLNLAISGSVILANGYTTSGVSKDPACIANAWITQFSVQAVDFNILIISITVLTTVYNKRLEVKSSNLVVTLLCVSAWIPSLITSNIGLGLGAYGYVSGNWCWIVPDRLELRYALTHGWRIAIFVITIAIYTCIYIRLRRVFGQTRMSQPSSSRRNYSTTKYSLGRSDSNSSPSDAQDILITRSIAISHELQDRPKQVIGLTDNACPDNTTTCSLSCAGNGCIHQEYGQNIVGSVSATHRDMRAFSQMPPAPNLKKILLLNGYPIAYIILWIPGIANRLAESIGTTPRWLTVLQASTQFVGMVNAVTYGLSEQMRRQIWREWQFRRGFAKTEG